MHVKAHLDVAVALYLQSATLWFLPPLDNSLPSPDKIQLPSQFDLASDQVVLPPWRPGRGAGVFEVNQYPIIVPKAHVMLETFLRI